MTVQRLYLFHLGITKNFGAEIVGEVNNNSAESAEYVEALATFRDGLGTVIDTASGYANPHLVTRR